MGLELGERVGGREQVVTSVSVHQFVFCPSTVAFSDVVFVTLFHTAVETASCFALARSPPP